MSRRWLSSSGWRKPERLLPLAWFVLLAVHGATLGLTDDEAYYWVLGQRPALGYAFHPPAVAWSIMLSEGLLGWLFGHATPGIARLPAFLYSTGILTLALRWLRDLGVSERGLWIGGATLLSYAGLFGLSWMIVPDLPLFFATMLLFRTAWRISFGKLEWGWKTAALLSGGATLALLSKFSGVIAIGCAGLAILLWAPRGRKWKPLAALVAGALVAVIPILVWNAQHDWGALRYQFSERHGGKFSALRFARFWGSQLLLAGPSLFVFAWALIGSSRREGLRGKVARYALVWFIPHALVFGLQPFWGDFKPHWGLMLWLGPALVLAWECARDWRQGWFVSHIAYGATLLGVVFLGCHWPLISVVMDKLNQKAPDPRWDVTNDMYGWDRLREFLASQPDRYPVIGARYQTASQAAFSLGDAGRVALIPRDVKQRDEWPDLKAVEIASDQWPRLKAPVYFVADHRYSGGPEFPGARCILLERLESRRGRYVARWVDVWRCQP